MSRFSKWAERKYTERQRILALLGLGMLFPIAIPLFLIFVSPLIDDCFHFILFDFGKLNIITGILLIATGGIFAFWSIYVQFTIGTGTPAPMMPTHKLLIYKPYSYCRNPMLFGTILLYLGIAIWIGSPSAVGLVVIFMLTIITYTKLIEEKELQERYGAEYLEYKRRTPFLLPKLWKK
jgi:protein-S-isoprenylcysteine O-methyltransferase Ste14